MSEQAPDRSKEDPLTGHEYDGIEEYDNPMPRWWVWIFWGTFYFAVCYFLYFHVYDRGTLVKQEYAQDMQEFREEMAKKQMGEGATEESLGKLMANTAVMTDAQAAFKTRCTPCHGAEGQGVIGPNLTDEYWIHGGGKLMDIHAVINEGVAAKGMPAWGKQLSAMEVAKLAAYVGTLRNKNVAGKPPEGQKVASANGAGG